MDREFTLALKMTSDGKAVRAEVMGVAEGLDKVKNSAAAAGVKVDAASSSVVALGGKSHSLSGIEQAMGSTANKAGLLDTTLKGVYASLGAISFTALVGDLVKTDSQLQSVDSRLKFFSRTTAEADAAQASLWATAKKLNADYVVLGDTYAKLLPLEQAGLIAHQQTQAILEGMTNAGKALGAENSQLSQSFFGLSQALASPVVHAEELAQIVEPLPGLLNALDRAAKLPSGGFRQMVNDGKVTATFLAETLVKALREYDGAASQNANAVEQSTQRIRTSWEETAKAFERPINFASNKLADFVEVQLAADKQAIQDLGNLWDWFWAKRANRGTSTPYTPPAETPKPAIQNFMGANPQEEQRLLDQINMMEERALEDRKALEEEATKIVRAEIQARYQAQKDALDSLLQEAKGQYAAEMQAAKDSSLQKLDVRRRELEAVRSIEESKLQIVIAELKEEAKATKDRAEQINIAAKIASAERNILDLRERQRLELKKLGIEENQAKQDQADAEIALRDKLTNIQEQQYKETHAEAIKSAKDSASAWEHAWEQTVRRIDDSFQGMWLSVFTGGQGTLGSLKNLALSMAAEFAHAAITRPLMVSMMGGLGLTGSPAAFAGQSGLGNLIGSGLSSGFGALLGVGNGAASGGGLSMAGMGSSIAGIGAGLYSGMLSPTLAGVGATVGSNLGVGLTGTAALSYAGLYSPWAAVGALAGNLLGLKGDSMAANIALPTVGGLAGGALGGLAAGSVGAALGQAAGWAAGPIGAIIGALLGSAGSMLFHAAVPRAGGEYAYSPGNALSTLSTTTHAGASAAPLAGVAGSLTAGFANLERILGVELGQIRIGMDQQGRSLRLVGSDAAGKFYDFEGAFYDKKGRLRDEYIQDSLDKFTVAMLKRSSVLKQVDDALISGAIASSERLQELKEKLTRATKIRLFEGERTDLAASLETLQKDFDSYSRFIASNVAKGKRPAEQATLLTAFQSQFADYADGLQASLRQLGGGLGQSAEEAIKAIDDQIKQIATKNKELADAARKSKGTLDYAPISDAELQAARAAAIANLQDQALANLKSLSGEGQTLAEVMAATGKQFTAMRTTFQGLGLDVAKVDAAEQQYRKTLQDGLTATYRGLTGQGGGLADQLISIDATAQTLTASLAALGVSIGDVDTAASQAKKGVVDSALYAVYQSLGTPEQAAQYKIGLDRAKLAQMGFGQYDYSDFLHRLQFVIDNAPQISPDELQSWITAGQIFGEIKSLTASLAANDAADLTGFANGLTALDSAITAIGADTQSAIDQIMGNGYALSRIGSELASAYAGLGAGGSDAALSQIAEISGLIQDRYALEKSSILSLMQADQQAQQQAIANYQAQVAAINSAKDSVQSYLDSFKLSDLSPLTPGQRLAEAQGQYGRMLLQAQAGDAAALQALSGSAQSYLSEARSFYASSPQYSAIFEGVQTSLEQALANVVMPTAPNDADYQAKLLDYQSQLSRLQADTVSELKAVKGVLGHILDALQAGGGLTDEGLAEIVEVLKKPVVVPAAVAK